MKAGLFVCRGGKYAQHEPHTPIVYIPDDEGRALCPVCDALNTIRQMAKTINNRNEEVRVLKQWADEDVAKRGSFRWSYCPCCGAEAPSLVRHKEGCPAKGTKP